MNFEHGSSVLGGRTRRRRPREKAKHLGWLLVAFIPFVVAGNASAGSSCTISGTPGTDVLHGTPHRDVICGGAGADTLRGIGGSDRLVGGAGADILKGGAGGDRLEGSSGEDKLRGNAGPDKLYGDPNDDTLVGGSGADLLDGGSGDDVCEPGAGDDSVDRSCEDTTPPTLTQFSLSPTSIDTSGGTAVVNYHAETRDDLSGTQDVEVDVAGPDRSAPINGYTSFSLIPHYEGRYPREFHDAFQYPRWGPQGTYTVDRVAVTDRAGNKSVYRTDDLTAAGFDTSFDQVGESDSTPPQLTDLSLSPSQLDTSGASREEHYAISATDDRSGIASVGVSVLPPGGILEGPGFHQQPDSGTTLDGTWNESLPLLRYSRKGTYTIADLFLDDEAGNQTHYTGAELTAAGYPTSFEQTGDDDHTPPVLSDLKISPRKVKTSSGPGQVDVTVHVTDDLTGVIAHHELYDEPLIDATLEGPTGQLYNPIGSRAYRLSGTALDGTFEVTFMIPRYSRFGTYTLKWFSAYDEIGNTLAYGTSDLQQLGFPTTVQNGP